MVLHAVVVSATLLLHHVTLELILPDTVRVGRAVPIIVRLTNSSRRPATLYSQGRPTAFDIVITRSDGTPVWRRLEHATISAVLQVRELTPGQSIEFDDTWSQLTSAGEPVPPGDYLVTGVLPTDPPAELRSRTARLRILP
jgi:hypothetical protein